MVGRLDELRPQLNDRRRAPRRARWLAVAGLAACFACRDTPAGELRRASSSASVGEGGAPISLDSALKLFRRDLSPVTELENAEPSIERVVARLVQSVGRSDTAALRELVMSRREFAYLYYPTSPLTRAPTKQEPELAWFLHLQQSQKGITRLLNRQSGKPLRIVRNECRAPTRIEGRNVLWHDCIQAVLDGRDTVAMRLFGGIYERDGRFKIFSYTNDL